MSIFHHLNNNKTVTGQYQFLSEYFLYLIYLINLIAIKKIIFFISCFMYTYTELLLLLIYFYECTNNTNGGGGDSSSPPTSSYSSLIHTSGDNLQLAAYLLVPHRYFIACLQYQIVSSVNEFVPILSPVLYVSQSLLGEPCYASPGRILKKKL